MSEENKIRYSAIVGHNGKAYIGVNLEESDSEKPEFVKGWWSDKNGKKIKEAIIGDKVRFHIETKNVKEGENLDLTLLDWDGWYDPDDKLEDYPKSMTIHNNKGYIEFILPKKWEDDIEGDYGSEIELYFEINYKGKTYELPKSTDDYLIVYEKEVLISVLIELPHSYYSLGRATRNLDKGEAISALGLAGHTAMAIGDKYFDYGPDYEQTIVSEKMYDYDFNDDGDTEDSVDLTAADKKGKRIYEIDEYFAPGRSWWGKKIARRLGIKVENVNLNQALEYIKLHWRNNKTYIYGEVHKIEFYVNESQADKMMKWWKKRYEHLKVYSVYPWKGEQCTTTTKSALQAGGIPIPDETQTPKGILSDMKVFVRSTSYKHRGEKPVITIIKKESIDYKP